MGKRRVGSYLLTLNIFYIKKRKNRAFEKKNNDHHNNQYLGLGPKVMVARTDCLYFNAIDSNFSA